MVVTFKFTDSICPYHLCTCNLTPAGSCPVPRGNDWQQFREFARQARTCKFIGTELTAKEYETRRVTEVKAKRLNIIKGDTAWK